LQGIWLDVIDCSAMALSDNPYIGLPLSELQEIQALYLQVLRDIAKTGRSYAFPGLSLTRADLKEVRDLLSELRAAIDFTAGGTGAIKQFANVVINTQSQFDP
jgi:hypothetical protein